MSVRLKMEAVRKTFGTTVALDGVGLSVSAGEVHALVGENGAGKSTLMKILSGAYTPDSGEMWLDEAPYAPSGPAAGRKSGIAMIYQELSLAPDLSVVENILLGMEPRIGPILNIKRMRRMARNALDTVGSNVLLDQLAGTLSVADQQLVEIARSVAIGARVLVLDEPTSSLAHEDVERLFQLVRKLKAEGYAIVYISHFLEEVEALCDTFTVLRDGASVGGGVTADVQREDIVSLMVGRDVSNLYPRSERVPGECVVRVKHLCGHDAPNDVSLTLNRGEVHGIAGLVGAGRTELLRATFGLDSVTSGQVKVGAFSGRLNPHRAWKEGLGIVSEDRKEEGLATALTVSQNMLLPKLTNLGPWPLVLPSRATAETQTWIDRVGIKCDSPDQVVDFLSGGNQQKIALARLLCADVDVLLLDEPTRGIDVGSKSEIYKMIDALACGADGREPKSVLVVSSYLPELLGICDRISVMSRGQVVESRAIDDWSAHDIMMAATGGVEVKAA